MRQSKSTSGERIVKDIKRQTRKQYSAEEIIRCLKRYIVREIYSQLCVSKSIEITA